MPKVSVIVPVYNTEDYLGKCLDSLVGQTLKDIEIIVVNDGSTDGSQNIIEQYAARFPEKIRMYYKENEGQAIARNWAIQLARGEYIGFLDSDDYADKRMYEKLYRTAVKENADLVICDYYLQSENAKKTVTLKTIEETKELLIDPKAAPWNKIYKASVVKDSGVKFHEHLIYEDTAFYANLVPYISHCVNWHEPLLYHLDFRKESTTSIFEVQKFSQMFLVMDGIIEYYKQHGFYNKYKDELEYFYSKILLGSSFARMARLEDKKERNEYLMQSLIKVEKMFPAFRRNKYYQNNFLLMMYVKLLKKWNVSFVGGIMRLMLD